MELFAILFFGLILWLVMSILDEAVEQQRRIDRDRNDRRTRRRIGID